MEPFLCQFSTEATHLSRFCLVGQFQYRPTIVKPLDAGCFTTVFFGKQEIRWLATCYNNILNLRSHLCTHTHLFFPFSSALRQWSAARLLVCVRLPHGLVWIPVRAQINSCIQPDASVKTRIKAKSTFEAKCMQRQFNTQVEWEPWGRYLSHSYTWQILYSVKRSRMQTNHRANTCCSIY